MRRTIEVKIEDEGRDKGKVFVLTEMPASQAERWAVRAFLALAHSGVELPDNIEGAGMAGIAVLGFTALSGVKFEEIEPLMNEMFACIKIKPDPSNGNIIRDLIEQDIEEVSTRLTLRQRVFELHTGFSLADVQSKSDVKTPTPGSSATQTSHGRSERSSVPARRRLPS